MTTLIMVVYVLSLGRYSEEPFSASQGVPTVLVEKFETREECEQAAKTLSEQILSQKGVTRVTASCQ